jgi:hypothetical protein
MDKLAEREIEVPASAFRSPTPIRPSNSVVRRKVRVPEPGEIAERERLR